MARGRGQDRSGHWALAFVFSDFWSREQVEDRAGATALSPGQGPAQQQERELVEVKAAKGFQ